MSKEKTQKSELDLLTSIDSKLTAILSLLVRKNAETLEAGKLANGATVGFLTDCGLSADEIALVLNSTKNSVQVMQSRSKSKSKK